MTVNDLLTALQGLVAGNPDIGGYTLWWSTEGHRRLTVSTMGKWVQLGKLDRIELISKETYGTRCPDNLHRMTNS